MLDDCFAGLAICKHDQNWWGKLGHMEIPLISLLADSSRSKNNSHFRFVKSDKSGNLAIKSDPSLVFGILAINFG